MRRDMRQGLRPTPEVDIHKPLKVLTSTQIQRLDGILAESGPFSEVWLNVRDGKLHSIKRVETTNAIRSVVR